MTTTMKKVLLQGCAALAMGFSLAPGVFAEAIDPQNYPALTDKQLGQVRHLVKLGNQLPGDWSGFGGNGEWEYAEHYLGFHSAFSVVALALAQHQYTPAYRELYKKTTENLIAKLTHSDVWERWLLSSRGGAWNREMRNMDPGWMDPVAKDNNMLKGYILLTGALYEMLYADDRYQQPGAYTFKHWVYAYSNGRINYRYTLADIAKILHQEVVDSNYVGSACEPGEIFYACNAASNAGFILYDHAHGTNYSQVVPKVKEAWISKGGLNPESYMVGGTIQTSWDDRTDIRKVMPAMMPMAAGYTGAWSGIFNNAWDPQFTKAAYYGPDGLDRNEALKYYLSGDWARKNPDPSRYSARWQPMVGFQSYVIKEGIGPPNNSIVWGFFLNYAAEVGDTQAVEKMLAYAEHNFGPVWEDGEYFYPRNDDYSVDAQGNVHGVVGWTGNVFLTLGRLNRGDGIRNLFRHAWTDADHNAPEIVGVNAATTNVSQAWWDVDKKALIVTLQPGPVKARKTSFSVIRLDPSQRYRVILDGKPLGIIAQGGTLTQGGMHWQGDTLVIAVPLTGKRSLVLVQA
jgi:hypothetical protein